MVEKANKLSPPYATFSSFMNFVNSLKEKGLPSHIDASVFGKASGSLTYSIIATLKYFGLILSDNKVTDDFKKFVNAPENEQKSQLRILLNKHYPTLWNGSIDITTTTSGQFDQHIREEYDVRGSTVDKVASFFIAAAKHADVTISQHLAARKPTASAANSAKVKKQRRIEVEGNFRPDLEKINPPPILPSISEKALEYRLVDLMSEAFDDPDVIQAIIKVITFLKTRDAEKKAESE